MIASGRVGRRRIAPLDQSHLPKEVTMLPQREREIAGIVYALRSATAKEVMENLSTPLHNASVRSMMNRLVRKGILTRTQVGRAFVYLARISCEQSASVALRRFAEDHFGGSLASAASTMKALVEGQGSDRTNRETRRAANEPG